MVAKNEKKPNHYVDKEEFYNAMCDFIEHRKLDPEYKISNYIGECIYNICSRIVYMRKFINYSYRDEMVSDAIATCFRYLDRFDPSHPKKNPFGYYTFVAHHSCINRINIEKGQVERKAKLVQSGSLYNDAVDTMHNEEAEYFDTSALSNLEYLYNYEVKEKEKKVPVEKSGPLDEFLL